MKEKSKQMIDGTRCNGCGVYLGEQQYESPRFCVICSKKGKPHKDLKAENERLRSVMGRMKELLEDIANGNRISSPPISAQEEVAKKLLAELAGMDRKERETMFPETKVISGVLCHREDPDGEWVEYSNFALTVMLRREKGTRCKLQAYLDILANDDPLTIDLGPHAEIRARIEYAREALKG